MRCAVVIEAVQTAPALKRRSAASFLAENRAGNPFSMAWSRDVGELIETLMHQWR
jgi:hypothetical protein